jgi:hypothetical protein
MAMKRFRKAASAGLLTALVATTLVACSPAGNSSVSTESATTREASAYRASRLCVLNDTDKTIMSVGEFEMTRLDVTHPDPTGPLEPRATWCTNGYNSLQDVAKNTWDASVDIRFSNDPEDFGRFLVRNAGFDYPTMWSGQVNRIMLWSPGFLGAEWERDLTIPVVFPDASLNDRPTHDYHLRRLDDTPDFKEWLITVRR